MSNDNYMTDAQGRLVPEEHVSGIDKLRDQTVLRIVEKVKAVRSDLLKLKEDIRKEIFDFLDISFEQFGKTHGGQKGNVSLLSFNGQYRVLVAVAEHVVFDERLQVAKTIIDECIRRWSMGAQSELKALVSDAFNVDKAGKLNVNRILGLRRLDISDPEWKRAMQAITESICIAGSKQYLRVYERDEKDDSYNQISLDFAAL